MRKATILVSVLALAALLAYAGVASGSKAVETAGTRVQLSATSQPAVWVTVQANCGNTGYIYVGGSTVSSSTGVALLSCDAVHLPVAMDGEPFYNLNEIYVDSSVNGEGVRFVYATRP